MKETESIWLAEHPEIRKKHLGEYIAISGTQVIAHGRRLEEVIQEARKLDSDPLICKVPEQEILIV